MRHAYGYANGDSNSHAYSYSNANAYADSYTYTDANTYSNSYAYTNTYANVDAYGPAETKPDTKAASDTAATSLALVENLKAGTRERKLASSPPAVAGDYSGSPACHADARRRRVACEVAPVSFLPRNTRLR